MATAPAPRPLAKSLHTITVLQRLAIYLASRPGSNLSAEQATAAALDVLGYGNAPDPYEIASRARSGIDVPGFAQRVRGAS